SPCEHQTCLTGFHDTVAQSAQRPMRHLLGVVVLGEVPAVTRIAPRAAQIAGSEPDEDARQPGARPFPLDRLEDLRNFEATIGTRHVLVVSWYERPWLIASAT